MDEIDLLTEWKKIEASIEASRERQLAVNVKAFGRKIEFVQKALALANRALTVAHQISLTELEIARKELALWTLARAADAYREMVSGNLAGSFVMHRSVVEGYSVLVALGADVALAEKFAGHQFVGQGQARKAADPAHAAYDAEAPAGFEVGKLKDILGSYYGGLSEIAQPTRRAAALQSEPEAYVDVDVHALPVRWTLGAVHWPLMTNATLPVLLQCVLGVVAELCRLPIDGGKRGWLMDGYDKITADMLNLWPNVKDAE